MWRAHRFAVICDKRVAGKQGSAPPTLVPRGRVGNRPGMTPSSTPAGMHRREFVVFIAAVMAVNALGVDLMLPALADIGRELSVAEANHRQWVITVYMLGFGAGQLVYGPLADRFGRRPVLMATLAGFAAASVFAASTMKGAFISASP